MVNEVTINQGSISAEIKTNEQKCHQSHKHLDTRRGGLKLVVKHHMSQDFANGEVVDEGDKKRVVQREANMP